MVHRVDEVLRCFASRHQFLLHGLNSVFSIPAAKVPGAKIPGNFRSREGTGPLANELGTVGLQTLKRSVYTLLLSQLQLGV